MNPIKDPESALVELLEVKGKMEQELIELSNERNKINEDLAKIEGDRYRMINEIAVETQHIARLRLQLITDEKKLELLARHVTSSQNRIEKREELVHEEIQLEKFEKDIEQLRDTIQNAINFYGEESLNLELYKRQDSIREKRVELTRLSSTSEELRKSIEEAKKAKERQRLAQLEQERLDEERRLRLEEEKELEEKEKKRQEFMQKRVAIIPEDPVRNPMQPFRNNTTATAKETSQINGENITKSKSGNSSNIPGLPMSISQFLRW